MTAQRLVQRVARSGPAQAFLTRPRPARVASVLVEATTVNDRLRFVWRELSASGRLARYRLRGSGSPIYIRHNTADSIVLEEIFYTGHYEPPARVVAVLDGLQRPLRFLDLGANIGLFGVWALERFPGAEIVGFEPDPRNAEIARRCIEANGAGSRWRIVEAAASNEDARVAFRSGEFSRSRIEPGEGDMDVEAVDVFEYLDGIDFLKVDIEGGEWAILGDPRFERLRVPVVVLEYHPDQAPGPDARSLAVEAVRKAGYDVQLTQEFGSSHGMLWAWRSG